LPEEPKEVVGVDVWKPIRRRKKIGRKMPILSDALTNLIGARHGVVHHFTLDRSLDRNEFLDLLHLVRALIAIMGTELERKLGVELVPG